MINKTCPTKILYFYGEEITFWYFIMCSSPILAVTNDSLLKLAQCNIKIHLGTKK